MRALRRFALILPLLLLVPQSSPAQCGQWTTKTLPGPEWKSPSDDMFMAYDENLQKLVLYAQQYDHNTKEWSSQFWAYDGTSWVLIGSGWPEMDPGWYFGHPFGMVFDRNRNALVIFATSFYLYPENGCQTVYQFLPDQGWQRISDCIPLGGASETGCCWTVTYDSNRNRAIIIGGGEWHGVPEPGPPITIEFDGWAIEIKKNPPDYKLYYGSAGFNPETGKTVFYGYGREFEEGEVLETFEYDGTTWALVETTQRPGNKYHPISGLTYSPTLHGLLAVPSLWQPMETWLYKNGEWSWINCGGNLPPRLYGIFQWDSTRDVAVYWGGEVEDTSGIHNSKDTLEFTSSNHCKPVQKP